MPLIRFLFFLFLVSVVLNFGWEVSQMFLYPLPILSSPAAYQDFVKLHWIASIKDGLIVVGLYLLVAIFTRNVAWGKRFSSRRLVFLISFGFLWAVGIEYNAVVVKQVWSYAKTMPLLPGLNVGIVPVVQMMILPLVAIFLVRKHLSEK